METGENKINWSIGHCISLDMQVSNNTWEKMVSHSMFVYAETNDVPLDNFTTFSFDQLKFNTTGTTKLPPFLNASVWRMLWSAQPNFCQISQAVGLSCIAFIGLVGNLLLLFSLPWVTNVNRNLLAVVVSIAFCDVLVCLVLPCDAYLIVTYNRDLKHFSCVLQGMLIVFPGLLKTLSMVQIALLCYMMVWNPVRHFRFQRAVYVNVCVIATWCLAVAFSCGPAFWFGTRIQPGEQECDLELLWGPGYKMLYLTQFFCGALFYGVAVLFIQCGIHKLKARLELNSRRRKCKRPASEVKRKNHIRQAVAFSVAASILCVMTVPYHSVVFAHFLLGYGVIPEIFIFVSYYLCLLHTIVNPIIYACHIKKVTDAYLAVVRHVARCLCCKCCDGPNPGSAVAGETSNVQLHTMSFRRPVSGTVLRLHTSLGGPSVSLPRIVVTDCDLRARREVQGAAGVNPDPDWSRDNDSDVWCSSSTNDFFSEDIHNNSNYDLSVDTLASGNYLEVPAPDWEQTFWILNERTLNQLSLFGSRRGTSKNWKWKLVEWFDWPKTRSCHPVSVFVSEPNLCVVCFCCFISLHFRPRSWMRRVTLRYRCCCMACTHPDSWQQNVTKLLHDLSVSAQSWRWSAVFGQTLCDGVGLWPDRMCHSFTVRMFQ